MTNIVTFPGLGLEFMLNRVAFSVFGHNIYWYGIIIATGFLLAVAYGLYIAPRFGMDPEMITDAIFFVVPSAIIGARLYYVIFNPAVCFELDGSFSLLRAIAFWDGGLAIYGGVIATVVSALIYCKVRKVDFWSGMDVTAYGLLIGQLVGRWGNFVNVEAYGSVTGAPWRMCSDSIANWLLRSGLLDSDAYSRFVDNSLNVMGSMQLYDQLQSGALGVHPTFLYESLWNLLGLALLILLMKRGRKFNGQMFLSYIVWYGLGRTMIEGLRTDSLYFFGTGIRSSQMLGIMSALVGAALFILRFKTAGPATPPMEKAAVGAAADSPLETEPPVSADEAEEPPEVEQEAEAQPDVEAEAVQDDIMKEEKEDGSDTD